MARLFDPHSPFLVVGMVNKYFLDAFNKVWNGGMKSNFLTLKNSYSVYDLWITGHSLGAAMVSIAAAIISTMRYISQEKIKLVTFGQSRVGGVNYTAIVDSQIAYSFRFVCAQDIVPHLSPKMIAWILSPQS